MHGQIMPPVDDVTKLDNEQLLDAYTSAVDLSDNAYTTKLAVAWTKRCRACRAEILKRMK